MKKVLLSILIISSFSAVSAAEQNSATIRFSDGIGQGMIIPKRMCNVFIVLRNLFADVGGRVEDLFAVPCTIRTFVNLAHLYDMQETPYRDSFLQEHASTAQQLISFVKAANSLDLDNSTGAYTDLIRYALRTLTVQQLADLMPINDEETGKRDNFYFDPEATERALQDMTVLSLGGQKAMILYEAGLLPL